MPELGHRKDRARKGRCTIFFDKGADPMASPLSEVVSGSLAQHTFLSIILSFLHLRDLHAVLTVCQMWKQVYGRSTRTWVVIPRLMCAPLARLSASLHTRKHAQTCAQRKIKRQRARLARAQNENLSILRATSLEPPLSPSTKVFSLGKTIWGNERIRHEDYEDCFHSQFGVPQENPSWRHPCERNCLELCFVMTLRKA